MHPPGGPPARAPASRKEARKQARLQRRTAEEEARRRRARRRTLLILSVGAVLVAAAGWGIWAATRPGPTLPVVVYPDQGRDHVAPGQPHPPYNSNPPTSGWHYPQAASWGFYATELPDELVVHNLEHGGIWISYRDADARELVDRLAALARRYRSKVIVTHRPANPAPLAVVAWGRLMLLDRYDEAAITEFIRRFRNTGPEFVPD